MRGLPVLSACLLTAAFLAGCAADGGHASVYVKDHPAEDWRALHITFTEVSIHQSGGDNETGGWRTLFSDSDGVTVDLLNATGARAAFLGESGLAPGKYQQIRITVTGAHGIDAEGNGFDLGLPPNGILKTSKSFRVEDGMETQIIIDFDLEKALVERGGQWEFKGHIGKVYTNIKEKADKPDEGTIETVELQDDAAA